MRSDGVIAVTGAASGIGRALALRAAAGGARVGLLDTDCPGLERVAAEIDGAGGTAVAVACDVTSEAEVARAFAETARRLGALGGLFAAAGVDLGGAAHELPVSRWERVLAVNLTGTFLCCREAIRAFLGADSESGGAIVCCSSPAASVAYPAGGASAYGASKAGVGALVRSLAIDYAAHGIRVNAIVPGATETPLMWANTDPAQRARLRATVAAEVPLGRLAEPIEPAQAALWLLSDEAAYVTGSELVCDGGILARASVSF